jgi:uncharacterized membrane protein
LRIARHGGRDERRITMTEGDGDTDVADRQHSEDEEKYGLTGAAAVAGGAVAGVTSGALAGVVVGGATGAIVGGVVGSVLGAAFGGGLDRFIEAGASDAALEERTASDPAERL